MGCHVVIYADGSSIDQSQLINPQLGMIITGLLAGTKSYRVPTWMRCGPPSFPKGPKKKKGSSVIVRARRRRTAAAPAQRRGPTLRLLEGRSLGYLHIREVVYYSE